MQTRKSVCRGLACIPHCLALALVFACTPLDLGDDRDGKPGLDLEVPSRAVVLVCSGAYRGSGFAWREPYQIITSWHVIGSDEIFVTFPDRAKAVTMNELRARVTRVIPGADLVQLTVDERSRIPDTVTPLHEMNHRPEPLEPVYAIGFALSLNVCDVTPLFYRQSNKLIDLIDDKTVRGRLRARHPGRGPDEDLIVLNLAGDLVPGLSGSPIVDEQGRLVGVGMGGLQEGKIGRGFGVPADQVERLLQAEQFRTQIPLRGLERNLFASADEQHQEQVGLERISNIRRLMQESIVIGDLEWKRGSRLGQFDEHKGEIQHANQRQPAAEPEWRLPKLGELEQIRPLLGTSLMPQDEGDRIWTGDVARNSRRAKAVTFRKGKPLRGADVPKRSQAHLRLVRDATRPRLTE